MPEIERKVETYSVEYTCDKCGVGVMRPFGYILMSSPPQYPHACNEPSCGHEQNFRGQEYPRIITKYVD